MADAVIVKNYQGDLFIPIFSGLQAGKYIIRLELINLANAAQSYKENPRKGAEIYPMCVFKREGIAASGQLLTEATVAFKSKLRIFYSLMRNRQLISTTSITYLNGHLNGLLSPEPTHTTLQG